MMSVPISQRKKTEKGERQRTKKKKIVKRNKHGQTKKVKGREK